MRHWVCVLPVSSSKPGRAQSWLKSIFWFLSLSLFRSARRDCSPSRVARWRPEVGPLSATITRLYGVGGWLPLRPVAFELFVSFPVFNLVVAADSAFHVSPYWGTLVRQIIAFWYGALPSALLW